MKKECPKTIMIMMVTTMVGDDYVVMTFAYLVGAINDR